MTNTIPMWHKCIYSVDQVTYMSMCGDEYSICKRNIYEEKIIQTEMSGDRRIYLQLSRGWQRRISTILGLTWATSVFHASLCYGVSPCPKAKKKRKKEKRGEGRERKRVRGNNTNCFLFYQSISQNKHTSS